MALKITRRNALAAGMAATGTLFGTVQNRMAHAWTPGSDNNVVRDLTPGTTPIRLGAYITRSRNITMEELYKERKTSNITEIVKQLKKSGTTGLFARTGPFTTIKDSELNDFMIALKKYNMVVFEVGGYRNILHPDGATREKNLKILASCIEIAEKLNCPQVGTCSGSRDPKYYINVHPDNWTMETWKLLVKGVKQVLRDTAGMKAALGMEAQVTTNIDGPRAHKRLIEDVGDPRCAVNLDPTNMISLSTYYHTTELINECFDLLGENIKGCHAKDTYIWPDKQTVHIQEVAAGRGVMDYETYLVRMSRLKWPRTLNPEHVPDDQIIESHEYIKKVAAKVGVKILY
ncbi:sugar phosphate isomerase/epimerase family protein [Candidatus Omnitrophota bacterium]